MASASHHSNTTRAFAATLAASASFAAMAQAVPLLDDPTKAVVYRADLSIAVRAAAGDDLAGLAARDFVVQFEKKLRAQTDKPQIATSAGSTNKSNMVVMGVVPPKGVDFAAVCYQKDGEARRAWNINLAQGADLAAITQVPVVPNPPSMSNYPACNATLLAAARKMREMQLGDAGAGSPASAASTFK